MNDEAKRDLKLPQLYTGRYLAYSVAEKAARGEIIPVRVSMDPPIIPLPYELTEAAQALLLQSYIYGAVWLHWNLNFRAHLDRIGLEEIARELTEISNRNGGKPLALLDYEDVTVGLQSVRVIFSAWWEEKTGQIVYELADSGEKLHYLEVHPQARPVIPKPPKRDRRFREETLKHWPLTKEQIDEWIESRYWQYARTSPRNPHAYTHRNWSNERSFELFILHLREYGKQEVFGGTTYTYFETARRKLWTMGAPLPATIIVNCKCHDEEEMALLAEGQTRRSREDLGLPIGRRDDDDRPTSERLPLK